MKYTHNITKLDWDSNFFKLEIGKLEIFEVTTNVVNITPIFDLIYVFSEQSFNYELFNYRLGYEENKVIFSKNLESILPNFESNIYSIREISFNLQSLYNLGFESGKYSRFKQDLNFNENQFYDFYKIWIDNSINFTFADDLFVYKQNDEIVGLISYKINNSTAIVGLLAVSNQVQGKGIGSKLIHFLEYKLHELGVKTLKIPTQLENIPACNFYKKQGYEVNSITNIKHFWKNE